MDLFSEPTMLACEVKISFKSQPYDPYILNRWLATTITQLTRQQNIAETCGWRHCVFVNKAWMKAEIDAESHGAFDVHLIPNCGSATAPQNPFEIPDTPLDLD